MYNYELLYKKLVCRYGKQDGLHDKMRELNSKAETLTYEEYFSTMKEICKINMGAYHVYYDNYMKWYDRVGANILPKDKR